MSPDVVVLGNLIVDDIVFEDGTTRYGQPGGAALYAALGASIWGVKVGLASVIGDDYPVDVLEALTSRGIALDGVRKVPGPSLRTWLLYEGRRRRVVHRLDSPSHQDMSPDETDIPPDWDPIAIHLAPMPATVQAALLERLAHRRATLSVDPYDLVDEDSLAATRALFARADIALVSEDELLLADALEEPRKVLPRLAEMPGRTSRLRRLLLKRGSRGGLAFDRNVGEFLEWKSLACAPVDPTGAGDAFAGGLLAGLATGQPFDRSIAQAVVSASLALEGHGASALLESSTQECHRRLPVRFKPVRSKGVPA